MKKPQKSALSRMIPIAFAFTLIIAAAFTVTASADTSGDSYLTQNDPLISYSYLTKTFRPDVIESAKQAASDYIGELMSNYNEESLKPYLDAQLAAYFSGSLVPYINEKLADYTPSSSSTASALVRLTAGQKLIADGICETVLRSGKAVLSCSSVDFGAADVTGGYELLNGDVLSLNHTLILDGSNSCTVVAVTDITVYVKGGYKLG